MCAFVDDKYQMIHCISFDKKFKKNIITTNCNSVQERAKNALSRTLLFLVFKIFNKENFRGVKEADFQKIQIEQKNYS